MMDNWGIVVAIAGLGVLIAVHEFGHFIIGKLLGLKVIEFVLGLPLGPKIAKIKRGETTYGISAVLFGGYVKFAELISITELKVEKVVKDSPAEEAGFKQGDIIIKINNEPVKEWQTVYAKLKETVGGLANVTVRRNGTDQELKFAPNDNISGLIISRDGQMAIEDIPRSFDVQRTWKRALIVFFGPAMNIALAVVIVFFVSLIGYPQPTTTLEKILPKSPAQAVGIRAGDRITAINGQKTKSWEEITKILRRNAGKQVVVAIKRDGERLKFNPTLRLKSKKGLLGIVTKLVRRPESLLKAAKNGVYFIGQATVLLIKFFGMLVTVPKQVLPMIRSPIGIVKETAPIAQRDILDYLITLAGLSVAIGLFNLLPIPPLDGGRLFISGIEGVIRRPVSRETMLVANAVGLSLLLIIMTYAVIGDLFRRAIPGGG